jgi:hypothetical protein
MYDCYTFTYLSNELNTCFLFVTHDNITESIEKLENLISQVQECQDWACMCEEEDDEDECRECAYLTSLYEELGDRLEDEDYDLGSDAEHNMDM